MAKHCTVCDQSYSDDLESCPHCAGDNVDEEAVDLAEIFGDQAGEDDLSQTPAAQTPGKKAVKTMMAMPGDEDAVDLGHGKAKPEATPSQRPKTVQVTPEEMDAVVQGKPPKAPSILDSTSAVDLGADDSSVNLGSSEHLGSADKLQGGRLSSVGEEAPTVEHIRSEDVPPEEHAAEDDDMPVVEHAAEEGEVADEGPPRKKKAGSRTWVAGAAGMVLGSAATLVLAVLNLLPFVSGGGDSSPKPAPNPVPSMAPAPVAAAAPAVTPEQYLAYGDFAKAAEGFSAQDTQEPALLVKRGQARWLAYLQEKKQAKGPLKKDDEAVAQAVKDLTEAKTAEAIFWLGLIEESTSGPAAARKIYQEGIGKFKQPAEQQLFQSALDRLDADADAPAARQAWRAPRLAETALALTIALQEPAAPAAPQEPPAPAAVPNQEQAPAAPPAKPVEEAGADFWKALRLAKEHNYVDALAAIAKARSVHDQQRFARLYKAQNPVTDPTETIFLRTCDELASYWRMRQTLAGAGYLAQGKSNDPVAALKAALAAGKESQGPNKALASLAELLKKDKDVVAADPKVKDVAKAIETLTAAKQRSQSQLAALQAALLEAKYVGDNQKDLSDGLKKLLEDKKAASEAVAAAARALRAGPDEAPDLAKAIAMLQADRKAAANTAIETNNKLFRAETRLQIVTKQLDAMKYAQATQNRSQGPRQMLEIWLPVLTQDRIPVSRSLCDTAARDGKLVADDRSTDAATRALALGIQGLALRGLGRYDEAKQSLNAALEADKSPLRTGDWRFQVQQARRALADPLDYYVPEARRATARGQYDQALARLEEGLAVFPKNTPAGGALLAERSAVLLAQAQSQGKVTRDNPRALEAGNEAKAAIAAKATAEGSYALGRWHEALGELEQARQAYEQAVAAHPALDVAGGRYRVALAQLLVRHYGPKIAVRAEQFPPPLRGRARVGGGTASPLLALIGLVVSQDEEQEVKPAPELDRAVQLADEAIQAGNPEGYLVKAVALAGKHRWTDAILEYSRGLEKGASGDQARVLRFLVENHPALRIPDGQRPFDVQLAERHFDQGLQYYWERRYPQAEKAFAQAIRSFDQDARFMYYLGLAQLGQERRDQAVESFRKGGMLEQLGKPQSAIISSSLERVQGSQRGVLNRYRP